MNKSVFAALAIALTMTMLGRTPGRAETIIDALADTHPDFQVTVTGQGRPVIFIPGLATPGEIWQPAVDGIKATCQCHVLTLAGFGGVTPTGSDPFLVRVRDEIVGYIRDNKLDHPLIVGHSLGGTLALWVAEAAPELPGRLLIVDAMPFMGAIMDPAATVASARAEAAPMVAQVAASSPAAFAAFQQAMIPQWVTSIDQAKRIATETSKSDAKTVARALGEMMALDLRGDLGRIASPTLVLGAIAGKELYAPKEEIIKTFHAQYENLRGTRFEIFDHARHFIMVDDPAGFQKALESELAAK